MNRISHDGIAPFDFHGLKIRDVIPSGRASLAEIEVAPGATHPKARSTVSDKIYTCLSGQILFAIDERSIELGPRESLEIPTGVWFEYENAGSEMARLLLVHVPAFSLTDEEILA